MNLSLHKIILSFCWPLIVLGELGFSAYTIAGEKESNPYRDCERYSKKSQQYACYKAYADLNNLRNQLPIPAACRDKKEGFNPMRYLYTNPINWKDGDEKKLDIGDSSWYNPKAYLYQPIDMPNGFIAYDFNRDRKPDYIFAERNLSLADLLDGNTDMTRLAVCMSIKQGYQRQLINVPISRYTDDGYTKSYNGLVALDHGQLRTEDANTNVDTMYNQTVNWYGWDERRQVFILRKSSHKEQSVEGGGSFFLYDLQRMRYVINYGDGYCTITKNTLEDGCKMGIFKLKGATPLLKEIDPIFYIDHDLFIPVRQARFKLIEKCSYFRNNWLTDQEKLFTQSKCIMDFAKN